MAQYTCTFTIPRGTIGGKLTGGFAAGNNPKLMAGDSLIVSVILNPGNYNGNPGVLTGAFVFTAAPNASKDQTQPSPFMMPNDAFECVALQQAQAVAQGGNAVFTFAPIPYPGGAPGSYELTFVAIDSTATPPVQWTEDPEFETGN